MPLTNDTLKKFKCGNIFFETGIGKGNGVQKAIDAGFVKIYSLEIDQKLIDKANIKFKEYIDSKKIEIILGDSKLNMSEALKKITEPATFWLDAHWDFGPVKGIDVSPLYAELTCLKNHPIKNNAILIDDVRCFHKGHHWGNDINLAKLIDLIKEINNNYKIEFADGDLGRRRIAKNDILVAKI